MHRLLIAALALPALASANETLTVTLHEVGERPAPVGEVTIKHSAHGLVFAPALEGLPPGLHGFHVHETGSCAERAQAAGGHLDSHKSGQHGTPWGGGHLGDLPALFVAESGTATHPVLAPRLTLDQVRGRALMIHEGGDNYADEPKKLGGGGDRLYCGVIPGDTPDGE